MSIQTAKRWWKEAVVYQIYPASFLDTNGDGLGDIPGIISKVPYLHDLGVDTVWLSPIFASPQKDMGYDISDYRSIHPPYGTVSDVQVLIDSLHQSNMRLLMDLVVNHTSDQHPWFTESRSSNTSSKRDWYFWRDPKYDEDGTRREPNNWRSIFGGSAWHFDEQTQQYYLALFLPSQPDLNWENTDMRAAAYGDMRFWLDRGVDGFRIDSMNLMSKHPDLPNGRVSEPGEKYQSGAEFFASGPRMHDYLREMREQVFDVYPDCMTVGELGFTKDEESVKQYVASDRRELNMLFSGDIVDIDFGRSGKYTMSDVHIPSEIRRITNLWQQAMPKFDGWNTVYFSNHDSGRPLTRYASDKPEYRLQAAKMLAMYVLSLAGTPFLLQGDEIGMANLGPEYGIEAYSDVEGLNYYNSILESRGINADMSDVLREMQLKARDHGRLPMQWTGSLKAGFTSPDSKPWMTINRDHKTWNVARQADDPQSVLSFWKTMLRLRKQHADILVYGSYTPIPEEMTSRDVIGFERRTESGKIIVLLNFSERTQIVSDLDLSLVDVMLSNGEAEAQLSTNHRTSVLLKSYGGIMLAGKLS